MIATANAPSTREQCHFLSLPVKETITRFEKMRHTRQSNTRARNERIQNRFNELYNAERKRYDDVIQTLCDEFSLAIRTIETILKS